MEMVYTQVCDDLLALLSRLKAAMTEIAEIHGLTPMQLPAMYSIMQGYHTMGQLAVAMHCDASNVTGIVDRLVTQGLIKREECKTDRRAKSLALTPKGKDLMDLLMREMPKYLGYDKLSPDEIKQLHSFTHKILSY